LINIQLFVFAVAVSEQVYCCSLFLPQFLENKTMRTSEVNFHCYTKLFESWKVVRIMKMSHM